MLIDLDVPPQGAPTGRRRRSVRAPFPVLVLLLVLLVLLGGETVPAPVAARLAEVAGTGGRAVTARLLTANALFTAHRGAVPQTADVAAWPLGPGGPRWTFTTDADQPELAMAGNTLVVFPGAQGDVTMVDSRTGLIGWQAPWDAVVEPVGDRIAVFAGGRLRLADAATGRTIWSRPAIGGVLHASGELLVSASPDGRASVYAIADGRPVVEGGSVRTDQGLTVVGEHILVYGSMSVAAYGLRDLRRQWRARIGPAERVAACAGAVCVSRDEGVAVLDPATGRVRWQDERWRAVGADGTLENADGRAARVDLATGRLLREWQSGRPVGDLVLSPGAEKTWVTRLGDGRVVGTLPRVEPDTCQKAGDYLGCQTADHAAAVWRLS